METAVADLEQLCAALGLDRDRVAAALHRERAAETSALSMPWFARLVVGVGAWVTALSAIGVGTAFMALLGTDVEGMLSLFGVVFMALGLWVLRKEGVGIFAGQLGTATAAAGVALIAAGIGMETREAWIAALAASAVTAIIIVATPKRTLQFLSALLAAVLIAISLVQDKIAWYLDFASLAGVAGVLLTLRPPQRDLQPTATVLLLLFPVLGIFASLDMSMYMEAPPAGGWFARVLHIGLFAWLASLHWARTEEVGRTRLIYFAPLAAIVCLVLPAGGSAALVIMMLAFVIGSRPLALLGTLLQIHYLWRFYYDMELTLLVKSGVLTATGVVILVVWWLMHRQAESELRR
jgi:hypothetical protein